MFGTVAEFLALGLFGSVVTAGIFVGRQYVRVASLRAGVEVAKTKRAKEVIEHELAIHRHQQNLEVLALTAGPSETKQKKSNGAAEPVSFKKSDLLQPYNPKDADEARLNQYQAEDARLA